MLSSLGAEADKGEGWIDPKLKTSKYENNWEAQSHSTAVTDHRLN